MRSMRLILGSMFVVFLLGTALTKQAPVVAVFDIEDRTGAMKGESLEQLTHYLATRLGENGRYRVVPRDTVKKRLRNSSRRSYRSCYDEACQVELGREVAASKIVSARILEIGPECRFTLQLYDLSRAATDRTASVKTECREKALPEAIDQAVARLFDTKNPYSRCPPGKIDIEGHCCWPGQDWGLASQRCLGEPRCPNGFRPDQNGCVLGCDPGMVPVAGHCCWPGQDWGVRSKSCLGPAECPAGFVPEGEGCRSLSGTETRQLCQKKFQEPCLEECRDEFPVAAFVRACLSAKSLACSEKNVRILDCGADPDSCKTWCRNNANVVSYCISSCQDSFEREVQDCRRSHDAFCKRRCPDCVAEAESPQ